jgi:probable HAF family extracellular repeat protein
MKKNMRMYVIALTLHAALAIPIHLAAQELATTHHHYKLIDLGTFGGPGSYLNTSDSSEWPIINNAGNVVGGADTSILTPVPGCYQPVGNPDCYISYAFAWSGNALTNLGALPGGYFSLAEGINQPGLIAGVSENDKFDPATGNPEIRAVLWKNGDIQDLGTLGGTASFAGALNDSGQIIGMSLNDVPDPYSVLGQGSGYTLTQTRGFLWQNGKMQDIGTLGGPDAWVSYINDAGQIAGASYTSEQVDPLTGTPPVGVFVWQNGKMKDLGNLGGDNGLLGLYGIVSGLNNRGEVTGFMFTTGNQFVRGFLWDGEKLHKLGTLGGDSSWPAGINDAGDIAGVSWLPGDQANDAFLWRDGVITDLGTLGGDPCSAGLAIDSLGQVLGASESAAGGCNAWTTAFLWENSGPMVDLNSLTMPSGAGVHLNVAFWANGLGEIVAGGGTVAECAIELNCPHTYVLIPCDENHPGVEGCDYSLVDAAAATRESPAPAMHKPTMEAQPKLRPFRRQPDLHRGQTGAWNTAELQP